jgi:hypothetical protein
MTVLQTPPFERLADRPPIILIGMHRSGTSLMSRLLAGLGVHLGRDLSENAESWHVMALNKFTFHAAGGEWNDPAPVIAAMQNPAFVAAQAEYYRSHLFSRAGGILYWGVFHWWSLRRGAPVPVWGWKDPRTSITLDAWRLLFPQAYVVHIIRNGIDVAISLHRRQIAKSKRRRVHPDHRDPRGFDFRFCFGLWETYQRHLLTYRETVPADRYIELRYEDLLREPDVTLRAVLADLGVSVNEGHLSAALGTINSGRLDNRVCSADYRDMIPELVENPLMKALGYPQSS